MDNNLKDIALRLQGIIDTAIDGIITIDGRGTVDTVNNAAAAQFGYRPDEIIGHNIKMLMPDPYHSEHDGYLERYQRTKEPRIIGTGREVIGKRKDGSQFPFRLAVSEVILNDRVIYTGIIHDLSAVKDAEQKLIDLNAELEDKVQKRTDELESVVNKLLSTNKLLEERDLELSTALQKEKELNELKSRFVSMASHEFRTPLSTILSSAALISRYKQEDQHDKREKHVERIKSSVVNLTGILNDFLSLSKIEEGMVEINPELVNLNDLCQLVKDEVKGLLKKEQTITHITDPEVLEIISDKRILKNILFNLVSNAIKYSGESGKIHCKFYYKNDTVVIEVEDNGMGIPEADQKHLFNRFFRATNVENIQGTGLGLSIVRQYVELLSGTISFISKVGVGTNFIVRLPQKITL